MSLDASIVPIIYRIKVLDPSDTSRPVFETTQQMMPSDVEKVRAALVEAYFHGAVIQIYAA